MSRLLSRMTDGPGLILGLMSGTSLDGLDLALVEWPGTELAEFRVRETATYDYSPALRKDLFESMTGATSDVCRINFRLGHHWAGSVNDFLAHHSLTPEDITCIGSHGQTLWHESGTATLQVGEPAVLAGETGIPVVSNFRENDIAAGGTGAPLIPYLDWLLYRQLPGNTVALNIGGIANITCVSRDMGAEAVLGWDTGPGNMVMDTLVRYLSGDRERYDHNGDMARRGTVDESLLDALMKDAFVRQAPPKSTGREYYSRDYVSERFALSAEVSPQRGADLLATACEWTAVSIVQNVERFWQPAERIDRVIVSGGGAYNRYLMERLASHMPNVDILTCEDFGIPIETKEAVGFALCAGAFLMETPANLPGVTGASRAVVLGRLTP